MRLNSTLGAMLLLAGTCIGGTMLVLPEAVQPLGVGGAVLVLCLIWAFMCYTGLLTLEANLHVPPGSNFISMTSAILGPIWSVLTTCVYVLLLYALITLYLMVLSALLVNSLSLAPDFQMFLTTMLASTIMLVIVLGARCADMVNRVFVAVLVVSFGVLLVVSMPHVSSASMGGSQQQTPWDMSSVSTLLGVLTAFGYHVVVPNMRSYLQSDEGRLKRVVVYGSLIPLLVYILWAVVFMVLPAADQDSLKFLVASGATTALDSAAASRDWWQYLAVRCFTFFAVISSLLGIALSMVHFMRDGMTAKAALPLKWAAKLALLLVFVPPCLFLLLHSQGFAVVLKFAVVFVAFLHGVLPAMMVYRIRSKARASGLGEKNAALWPCVVVMVLSVVVIAVEMVALYTQFSA